MILYRLVRSVAVAVLLLGVASPTDAMPLRTQPGLSAREQADCKDAKADLARSRRILHNYERWVREGTVRKSEMRSVRAGLKEAKALAEGFCKPWPGPTPTVAPASSVVATTAAQEWELMAGMPWRGEELRSVFVWAPLGSVWADGSGGNVRWDSAHVGPVPDLFYIVGHDVDSGAVTLRIVYTVNGHTGTSAFTSEVLAGADPLTLSWVLEDRGKGLWYHGTPGQVGAYPVTVTLQ